MEEQTDNKLVVIRIEGTNKEEGIKILKRHQRQCDISKWYQRRSQGTQ